jgi:NTE family protein
MAARSGFGLALGAGFLRGFAHLGVLGVLEEAGLRPGWIAGTSAGAVAAAFAAFGRSAEETAEALEEADWGTITKGRPRRLGLSTNQGLEELLLRALGDVRLEDADIPLGVVATDINTGNRVLLERGSAARAVRASCCVPGLYVPVEIEGRMLVDGALTQNVPARAVREMGAPLVVAVSLGFGLPYPNVRSLTQVLANTWDIATHGQMRFEILAEADLLIDPDLERFSAFRDGKRAEIVQAGRNRALEALPALRELLAPEEPDNVTVRWMQSVRQRMEETEGARRRASSAPWPATGPARPSPRPRG